MRVQEEEDALEGPRQRCLRTILKMLKLLQADQLLTKLDAHTFACYIQRCLAQMRKVR